MSSPAPVALSPLRALAVLGSASGLTIVAGVLSQKIAAVMLAPAGVGQMGLVIAYTGVVGVLAGLGANTALVAKVGAAADDPVRISGLVRAARRNSLLVGACVVCIAAALSPFVGEVLLGEGTTTMGFVAATAAGAVWAMNSVEIGILVAHHRVRSTARVAAMTCFISPVVNLLFFLAIDRDGIIPGALVSITLVFAVTRSVVQREVPIDPALPMSGRRELMAFGLPVTLSSVIGSAAVLTVPVLTTRLIGEDGTGYYRAAAVLAEGYLVVITTTISQDFFPRVARTTDDRAAFSRVVTEQLDLVAMVFAPIGFLIAALLPLLMPILYTDEFRPAEQLVRLQLAGDFLRLTGSVLATALLASMGSATRLATEGVSAAIYVALTTVGLLIAELDGLGIAFSVHYTLYTAAIGALLWRYRALRVPRRTTLRLVGVAGAMAGLAAIAVPLGRAGASAVATACLVPAALPLLRRTWRSRSSAR